MGIASYKPDVQLPVKPNLPKIEPQEYKSIVQDDQVVPLNSLIAYIEGAPWTVEYYSQVVSKHNDIREVDPGQPNVYQQYQKISKLEIRVSSSLVSNYDTENAVTTVSGNGLLYPSVIPNVSDYFVTDAGDHKTGIFRVTNVERKTFNKDSAFYIEYDLVGYTDTAVEIFNDLNSKVIRTYFFSKDRLIDGLQPMVKAEDHQQIINLKNIYKDIVLYYFKTFFNRKFMTLVLPGQDNGVYDSFLVNYLLKIVDNFDAPEIINIKQLPTDHELYLNQPQFWQAMLERDYSLLTMCNKEMGLVSKRLFNADTFIRGLALTNIEYIVYPNNPDTSILVKSNPLAKLLNISEIIETKSVNGTLASFINDQYVEDTRTYQVINPVLQDKFYVLSQNFYEGLINQSLLEILVKDYLKNQALNLNKLILVCSKFKTWGRLEQFYYGPILLTLIKEADRATYT